MPQLPSGQHVSVSADRALSLARDGLLSTCEGFGMRVAELGDIAPLIDVVPYRVETLAVIEEDALSEPSETYELTLADIETPRCAWSADDKRYFLAWLAEPRTRGWLTTMFEELRDLFEAEQEDMLEASLGEIEPIDEPAGRGAGRQQRGKGRRTR
ncbi:MAG: hypothetical protein JO142_16350 [Burkholderiales bacterium]|nr:hypothetical protein [Burkholderiales bacterium]